MARRKFAAFGMLLVPLAGLSLGSCVVEIDPNSPSGDPPGTTDKITVVIINRAGTTLDPELYISADPVSTEALFASGNKYTRYGVGTRGLLGDFDTETLTFECTEVRVIGTRGGSFGDDLDNPVGTGVQRVLVQDAQFECSDRITLTYTREIGGTYNTTVSVN